MLLFLKKKFKKRKKGKGHNYRRLGAFSYEDLKRKFDNITHSIQDQSDSVKQYLDQQSSRQQFQTFHQKRDVTLEGPQ